MLKGAFVVSAVDLGVDCLPIPGTKTLAHALENISAAKVSALPHTPRARTRQICR